MAPSELLDGLIADPRLGVLVLARDGTITQANSAFARLIGLSTEDLSGRALATLLERPIEAEASGEREIRSFMTATGREAWGELFRLPARPDGSAVVLIHDYTQTRYEERLHKGRALVLEQLYRDADLTSVCHAIVSYIESVARGVYCSILLLDPERGTLHKAAAPSLPDFYNEAIDGMKIGDGVGSCGTAAFRGERVIVADILNHPYWARARRLVERTPLRSCWSEPIISGSGKILGTFAIYYGAAREPNQAELTLIRSAAELAALAIDHKRADLALREADRLKDEFIALAAHELRTPISTLLGYSELLLAATETRMPAAEHAGYAAEIDAAGARLIGLIDDLLDLSKIRSGIALTVDRRPVALRPLVEKVIRPLRHQASGHSFRIIETPPLPETVVCDEWRLMQLFENLLGNAVKYSPTGGEIITRLHSDSTHLHVAIADQGVGMSPEQLARAFDKFYRGHQAAAAGGLGLGLSIVRHIVAEHGGEIRLESQPGGGTTVHFSLALT